MTHPDDDDQRDPGVTGKGPTSPSEEVPSYIGPYRVLDVLGEGGMGTVYVAEQKEPIRRRVALKVIKLGMDSKRVLKRFEAERQALALMDHDNIARVLDAGMTDSGQPFFAMEYVKGVSITEYCDQNKCDIETRLRLFRQVCSGVHHSHQKGVIHRDLKPGNILITQQDDQPRAKIIDFGLARATDHRLLQETMFTEQGAIIGTPEYMSPEQAGLRGADVDARTDVYSLGVVVFELLTGTLPFPREELLREGLLQAQRIVREEQPPTPSEAVTSAHDRGQAAAESRGLERRQLRARLRGDLEWIVLRALEKQPARRYESAASLSSDMQRHLASQPVLAGSPGWRRKVGRLLSRRAMRPVALAASLAVAALGTWYLVTESRLGSGARPGRPAEVSENKGASSSQPDVAALYRIEELGIGFAMPERLSRISIASHKTENSHLRARFRSSSVEKTDLRDTWLLDVHGFDTSTPKADRVTFERWVTSQDPARHERVFSARGTTWRAHEGFAGSDRWEYHDEHEAIRTLVVHKSAVRLRHGSKEIVFVVTHPLRKAGQGNDAESTQWVEAMLQSVTPVEGKPGADSGRWDFFHASNYLTIYSWARPQRRPQVGEFAELATRALQDGHEKYFDFVPRRDLGTGEFVIRVYADRYAFEKASGMAGGMVCWYSPLSREVQTYWTPKLGTMVLSAILHEGWHQFSHRYFSGVQPHRWFEEGMGILFECYRRADGRWTYSVSQRYRRATLRLVDDEKPVPFRRFLGWEKNKFYSARAQSYYAQAYAIVDFLYRGRDGMGSGWHPAWDTLLRRYVDALIVAKDAAKIDLDALVDGKWSELEKAWSVWVKNHMFQ